MQMPSSAEPSDYDAYVEHPRYGKRPRITGIDPQEDPERGLLFWISPPECRIPYTAIKADMDRQNITAFPIPWYFDQRKICKDCERPFIFFAEEQRYWFEELGFYLGTECLRCAKCRKEKREKAGRIDPPPEAPL